MAHPFAAVMRKRGQAQKRVGRILRKARESAGLSKQTVAKRLKSPVFWIDELESGVVPIFCDELDVLASAYGAGRGWQLLKAFEARTRRARM